MSAQPAPDDQLNEYLIHHCYDRMLAAPTKDEQSRWFERMGYYVGRRSPERIQEMELNKGLA
jgi:hypothetical protein